MLWKLADMQDVLIIYHTENNLNKLFFEPFYFSPTAFRRYQLALSHQNPFSKSLLLLQTLQFWPQSSVHYETKQKLV